jgi:serine/threonine protein kinase
MAKKKNLTFLPQFISLKKTATEVILTVNTYPQNLRELMVDSSYLERKGNVVVRCLLQGLIDAHKKNLVIRNIHPAAVQINESLGTVMFADTKSVTTALNHDEDMGTAPSPYNSNCFYVLRSWSQANPLRDDWSVGIMMLEILVGYKVVLSLTKYLPIQDLLESIQDYIDKDTWEMVSWLLNKEGKVDLKKYIQGPLTGNPDLISSSAKRIQVGMRENYELAEFKQQSHLIWAIRKKEMCQKF